MMNAICTNGHKREIGIKELETLLCKNGPRDTPQWREAWQAPIPESMTLKCQEPGCMGRHRYTYRQMMDERRASED